MTVYAVHQDHSKNFASVRQYGALRFINPRFIYTDEVDDNHNPPPDFLNSMRQTARAFNPDRDYLLLVGDQLQLVMMAALLAKHHGSFKVLRYDREAVGYAAISVNV